MGYSNAVSEHRPRLPNELAQLVAPNKASSINRQIIEPRTTTELSGSLSTGLIRIYKQVHTVHTEDFPTTQKIGVYQAQIYNHLIRTQPHTDIFFEGLQTDFNSCNSARFSDYCYRELYHWIDLWNKTDPESCANYVREQFANYSLDKKPSETQYYYLGALGAARIFAICYAGVTLHRTTDSDFESSVIAEQSNPRTGTQQEAFERTQLAREARALSEIKLFLSKNPGRQVDLVYGRWHRFKHAAQQVFEKETPLLVAYDWPDLASELGWQSQRSEETGKI